MANKVDFIGCKQIVRCLNFASIKHKNQRRKDEEETPYINHPIGVAHILTEEANICDVSIIQGALLHDTVEDTDTTLDEIKDQFGEHVARIVADVTDDKSLPKQERKRLQIEHSPHACLEAKFVKLADKLYNLRDLHRAPPKGWSAERTQEYFEWSAKVIDGIRGTDTVLEKLLDELFKQHGVTLGRDAEDLH